MNPEDTLIAYLQDRLPAEAVADFEAAMARDPQLRAEVSALRAAAAATGENRARPEQSLQGWQDLSQRIETERRGRPANDNRGLRILKVASIAAAAVMTWQLAVVPMLPNGNDLGFTPASVHAEGSALHVVFANQATVAQINALLSELDARVIDGPSAIGLYTLSFADEATRDRAEEQLSAQSALVVTVTRP